MRKILKILILLLIISLGLLLGILSTIGIQTGKFNNLISQRINDSNYNVKTKLNDIKFKLDLKELSLFLETNSPDIVYKTTLIPTNNLKVYIDFLSIFKNGAKIKKMIFVLDKINIESLKKISSSFKPSNFNSFINNKVKTGVIYAEVEFFFNKKNSIDNFITKGKVTNFKTEVIKNLNLENVNFSFFADKTDLLIKDFNGVSSFFQIEEGDLKVKLSPKISLEANFNSNIKYMKQKDKFPFSFVEDNFSEYLTEFDANLSNHIKINLDETYKVKDFNYRNNGNIINATFEDKNLIDTKIFKEKINVLSLTNSKMNSDFSSKKKYFKISGKYSLNKNNSLVYDLENTFENQSSNLKINGYFDRDLNLEIINYRKTKGKNADISLNLDKKKNVIKINQFNYKEGKNILSLKNLKIKDNNFSSFEKIKVVTYEKGIKNNDFSIFLDKKIKIEGNQYDARNLLKYFNEKSEKNMFSKINKKIEIDLSNIIIPLSEQIKDFKLIGKIDKGKFSKISSKGDFGYNNFLDVKMRNDEINEKKYLEIYSDKTKPFLTEYSFFEGLTGGKLLFTSTIFTDETYEANLRIEDFKVKNAPGMVKLLSLADLGGLADLAEGEGISFDTLEINMKKTNDILKINEILALGPSISVLMEGYQDKQVTSLRGTLVPAKTLNKLISKIPVIGDIVIPKEVGEGLFGISFKLKGPPGKIKTSINPIRTITPRFIQKIVDKNKKVK
tara:strand:+ start:60 stop:2246 length:2187 start_codon:yes stop_codon:yes gene_type:complete